MSSIETDNSGLHEKAGAVAQSYAGALFEVAQQARTSEEVAQELGQIADLMAAEPQLKALFNARAIPSARLAATLRKLFEGRVSTHVLNLLLVMNDNGRLGLVPSVVSAFNQRLRTSKNQIEVEVHTARNLSADQLADVGGKISKAINAQAVIRQRIDPSLIGGLRIRIGDKLIDGSVATSLKRLRNRLIDRSHELVRTGAAKMLAE